ncbi:aminotransferase [Buttiauxella ferragutiae ATCC 51602]|uniref:Aminotransferase n=1 Tax=Buttiauxella ferragutiae ATCC 51602 TaxID=1354252 RepID=A0ABX2W9W0_9ENTR|nr:MULTISPECIES: PLP-dependent aminotransferase family protein [Buttiauxella]AYN29097.1 PLP-dependent aminotransferase family protein [Buttiauxella sp. 3AFRM03]MCE0827328.1 PLP-dependent aminotransferase family protein [Buttiauxella ferragutiae]OAT28617.1 aminotransferase [Buttiauxella ferragutiae ATCC 51602]TDN47484.1 DNA-binding transcriptional MocR family regulator [Buttiauxella sp. JUb87]UNK62210.1 PLP-dependent aminotransferase family protein [Buttiauxella ferragutiae]
MSHSSHLAQRIQALQPSAIRELLKHSKMPGVISLAGGIPSSELFDKEGLGIATQKVVAENFNDAFQYGLTEGTVELRQQLVGLCQERGITTNPEQLLITSGSQQALDLLMRALVNPGDVFVVERPTYLATLQILSLNEADVKSVGSDEHGMKVDELEELLKTTRIKGVYLVPTFGNPSGTTLSASRREQLVKLAEEHHFVIVEDDPYGAISFTDTREKTLLQVATERGSQENVVYTSTFSKILAPGLRVGWIVLPEWMKQKVAIIKQATDLHANSFTQSLVSAYLTLDRLNPQIELIREAYKKKCLSLSKFLHQELSEHITFNQPQGGMFLWAAFRYEFDTTRWLQQTLEKGVVYVPGEFFFSDHADKKTLRFSYATATEEQLYDAVQRLKSAL